MLRTFKIVRITSLLFVLVFFTPTTGMADGVGHLYEYDIDGKLMRQWAATGETMVYSYDVNGNMLFGKKGELTYYRSRSFGEVQGAGNWYYQIWDGTQYREMSWDASLSAWRGNDGWSRITREWMHPDTYDTVLKWVAPKTGTVKITGGAAKHPINLDGDGVRIKIKKGDIQIWPQAGWYPIAGTDATGVEFNSYVQVSAGDSIYFVLNQNGHIGSDGTRLDPVITYMDHAASSFGSIQGVGGWHYQTWNGNVYKDMTWDSAISAWRGSQHWARITKDWVHPDTDDVVLKWVAPRAGAIQISGTAAKHPINLDGDGVRIQIKHGSTQIWPSSGWHVTAGNDALGVQFNSQLRVKAGEPVYFILNQNGNYGSDGTKLEPVITYLDKASNFYGSVQGNGGWYYQT